MISIKSLGAVALFLASFAAAQSNITIDASTIDAGIRADYCRGQENTCGTLCDGNIKVNDCSPTTLIYACTCASNGSAPGLQYYTDSMPSYLCQEQFKACNQQEVSAAGKARCDATRKANCGTLNSADYTPAAASSSSSSASSTSAPTSTGAGAAATTAPATTTSSGLAPTMAAGFGTGVFAVGVAAAFGLML